MNKFARGLCLMVVFSFFICMLAPISHASSGDTPDPLEKYRVLLNNAKIADAIYWIGIESEGSYVDWDDEEKKDLCDAILRLENNAPFPMQSPPLLNDIKDRDRTVKVFSNEDAWTIYVTHVAHSLWLEANHLVNWSLLDYNDDELALLLNSEFLMVCSPKFGYWFNPQIIGDVTDWNVEISYQFMKENQYILDDPASTVYAFADWVRYNVEHILGVVDEGNYKKTYGYPGPPPADKVLYPIKVSKGGFSYSAGCWGTTGLFAAAMRSVNIPVINYTKVQFGSPGVETVGYHSRLELPTLGIGLCHSDDLYGSLLDVKNGGAVVPIEKLFHTLDWLDEYMDYPTILDESDTYKNRREDQAAYNWQKYMRDLAIDYLTDGLLVLRADDLQQKAKPTKLKKFLASKYAKPFYSDEEIAEIIKKVDDELIRIGNGSWKKGAAIVRKRVYKWV